MDKKMEKQKIDEINAFLEQDFTIHTNEENFNIVAEYFQQYIDYKLPSTILGKIYEIVNPPDSDGFSKAIPISELIKINPAFRTTNGSTWNRADTSWLAKKYNIINIKSKGSITAVKLDGFNKKLKINQSIKKEIVQYYKKQRCSILDISKEIECDHKDGMKNDPRLNDKEQQTLNDFMALSKAANDAKRGHCAKCKESGKRYDARLLGYAVSFTKGDFDSKNCPGCYWYDPKQFNAEISKDFKKEY